VTIQEESATYFPGIFDAMNETHARNIIITPTASQPSQERWVKETPHIIDLILEHVTLDETSVVLDYGCGIGRLAKELIARTKCKVIGVDISPTMLSYASLYVKSDNFSAVSPKIFKLIAKSLKFDFALSVWVLQHCPDPHEDIALIACCLDGKFFVANDINRVVPTLERGLLDDLIDIDDEITKLFMELEKGKLSPTIVPEELHTSSFWGLYSVWR